jgi:hypothetical protein
MQVPTRKTPVKKCLALALFAGRMMAKYEDNPRMVELAARFAAGRVSLADAQRALEAAEEALTVMRVDLRFEDHASDQWLRQFRSQVEIADGRKNGRLGARLLPDGTLDITRRYGAAQVAKMRELEARLAAAPEWSGAPVQLTGLAVHSTRYEAAVAARLAAEGQVVASRAARDMAKERFLHLYAEIAAQIRSELPRDRDMQDLFFDTVIHRARRVEDAPEDELPADPEGEDDAT